VKEEGAPQARLAEFLEIEPISVSRLLDRMETGGWITRRQDVSDRRVRMIFPTDKSRRAFEAVKAVAGAVYEQAVAGLDEHERRTLVHGLKCIVDNLSDGETPSAEQTRVKGTVS
jgi:DNA-binding MarR family transcriptional regulator